MNRTAKLAAIGLALVAAGIATGASAADPSGTTGADLPDTVVAQLTDGVRVERITVTDLRSAARRQGIAGGDLTPVRARELLGTQLDRRALRLAAAAEPPAWTPQDSARHRELAGQLAFEAALDSAFAVERARRAALSDTPVPPEELGPAMRDLELARRPPVWDDGVVALLTAAFSALPAPAADDDLLKRARKLATCPVVAAADSDLVVAMYDGSPFLVRDLLREWRRLPTLGRPHLADVRQVRDFIGTALYQRQLRALARPVDSPQLQDQAEGFAAKAWAVRHVFSLVPRDSATLRQEYDREPSRWDLPARAEIVRRHLATRQDADRLATRLHSPAAADSLAAVDMAEPDRVPDLVDERGDGALVARCLAAGRLGVVGPDSLAADAWRVILVLEASARRPRSFTEARDAVDSSFFNSESERRLRAALDGLRRQFGERINEAALASWDTLLFLPDPPVKGEVPLPSR